MPDTITQLDSPIDVMYPIHKALRAEAAAVEGLVRRLQGGASCQACVAPITRWATALEYHAVMEDTYMTAPLARQAARTNEEEHHQLTVLLGDLQTMLQEASGQEAVSPRTLRHMLGKVVALRVAQDDHLEEEEERVLPIIRQYIEEAQQLAMVQRLLVDQNADNPQWVMEWLRPHITTTEQQLLTELTERCAAVVS